MLENQAFGWLKNAISRGSISGGSDSVTGNNAANSPSDGHTASIDSCSDVTLLVDGLVEDFEFVLRTSSSSSSSSFSSSPPPPPSASPSPPPSESSLASPSEPRQGPQLTPTEPRPPPLDENQNQNQPDLEKRERHLNDLTARLDRIKSLLYEERSASTHAAHAGSSDPRAHGDVFTPPVATALLNSFTFRQANHGHPALLPRMLHTRHLPLLPFEARKSVSAIVNYLLVCGLDGNERDRASYWRISELFAGYILMCSRGHEEDQDEGGENYGGIIGQWVRGHYCNHGGISSDTSNDSSNGHIHGNHNSNPPCVDITLLCGSMLRSSLRHPSIYQWILSSDLNARTFVYPFLNEFVHDPNFDVSSDALETVRVMLTGGGGNAATLPEPYARQSHREDTSQETQQHWQDGDMQQQQPHEPLPTPAEIMEQTASQFLQTHYKPVLQTLITHKCLSPHPTTPSNKNPDPNNPHSNPNPIPTKPNYMTRRLTLQLLSTLLLNRSNYPIMIRYISSSSNLVTIMCLLRDPSPHITLEAFQVFKIFVANPRKEPEVKKILVDNRVKLVRYLEGFHAEREGVDEQFREEKGLVIATLKGLVMDDEEEAVGQKERR